MAAIDLPPLTPRFKGLKVAPDLVGDSADHAVRKNANGVFEYWPRTYHASAYPPESKPEVIPVKRVNNTTTERVQRDKTPPVNTKPIRTDPVPARKEPVKEQRREPVQERKPVVIHEVPADTTNRPYVYRRTSPKKAPYVIVQPTQPNPPYTYQEIEKSPAPVVHQERPIEPIRVQPNEARSPTKVITQVTPEPEHKYRYRKTAVPKLPYNPSKPPSRDREYTYHSTGSNPTKDVQKPNKSPTPVPVRRSPDSHNTTAINKVYQRVETPKHNTYIDPNPIQKTSTYTYNDVIHVNHVNPPVQSDPPRRDTPPRVINVKHTTIENNSIVIEPKPQKITTDKSTLTDNYGIKEEMKENKFTNPKQHKPKEIITRSRTQPEDETGRKYSEMIHDLEIIESTQVVKQTHTVHPERVTVVAESRDKYYQADPIVLNTVEVRKIEHETENTRTPSPFTPRKQDQKIDTPTNQNKVYRRASPVPTTVRPRYIPPKLDPVRTPTPEYVEEPEYVPETRRYYRVPPRASDYYRVLALSADPMMNGNHRRDAPRPAKDVNYSYNTEPSRDQGRKPRYYNAPRERDVSPGRSGASGGRSLRGSEPYSNHGSTGSRGTSPPRDNRMWMTYF